ncbi:MAG: WD40/YVTN/BNR-like repeat-containing protein, partial [Planctomycetota bacterium]
MDRPSPLASITLLASLALPAFFPGLSAQEEASNKIHGVPSDALEAYKWREVGPYRGGRSAAVAGIPQDRQQYYFGATGGGVWKTLDGGRSWENVSDGFFGGSIGAVAVSEWDPNVVYVGGGEKTLRGNVSHGDGMWRSTDAGRSWHEIGLKDSRHISRIRIHPKNPDLVYAAVMGHLFGPNEERGVFRSKDGGQNWEKVLFVSDKAGCVDLAMDPTNPRILYASIWQVKRTPYSLDSGGPDSGMYKSTDGGDNWEEISANEGLPEGPLGIVGIAVSASNPDNLYAMIEAKEGGLFRSRDAGETWTKTDDERDRRQRAWYYTRVYADPVDEESVYVLNVQFHHSKDGGRSFTQISVPHGDNHDLWIDPNDPKRMIQSNDGGANVSFDGGETWTQQDGQPTAQMYRVSTDNDFPYRLLGGQQDNSAVRIRSRSLLGGSIGVRDWEPTAGGESGFIVAKPDNPDIVIGGSYGGTMVITNHRTGERRSINVWPDNPMGWGAADLQYRFQWNYPIFFSPHDPDLLYAAANVLFVSRDLGGSWEPISPDLTRNEKSMQGSSGGPITQDNTSVEYYCTIFAALESPHEPGVIWTGSDDGLIYITRNAGKDWENVTPPGIPEWMQINNIEAHPRLKGGLYVAGTRYKSDDFAPYLYKTEDYGKTWTKITDGIDPIHFTRAIRADPERQGLLYAGTERGMYVSYDDGKNWSSLQLNLPVVPITDLAVKEGDLVAATQGRGYWILDNVSFLHQLSPRVGQAEVHLFTP